MMIIKQWYEILLAGTSLNNLVNSNVTMSILLSKAKINMIVNVMTKAD